MVRASLLLAGIIPRQRAPSAFLCPQNCQSVVIVSGFQAGTVGRGTLTGSPSSATSPAGARSLGKPTAKDRQFFQDWFWRRSTGCDRRVSRSVEQNGKIVHKFRRRSAIQNLNRFLGKTATFNLAAPDQGEQGDMSP